MLKKVSVVVPYCNEEQGMPALAERLGALKAELGPRWELEIVIVDDGSSDDSRVILAACLAKFPNVVDLGHEFNRGLGAAIRTGWSHATGDFVCTIDADCTYDPLEIARLLEALELDKADIATGSPYHPQGRVEGTPQWRLLLSRGASSLYRIVSGERIHTFTSLMRAYRRRVVKSVPISSDGFVAVAEILVRALKDGYRVTEVPMVLRSRASGTSKMKTARTIMEHLKLMTRAATWRPSPSGPFLSRTISKADTY